MVSFCGVCIGCYWCQFVVCEWCVYRVLLVSICGVWMVCDWCQFVVCEWCVYGVILWCVNRVLLVCERCVYRVLLVCDWCHFVVCEWCVNGVQLMVCEWCVLKGKVCSRCSRVWMVCVWCVNGVTNFLRDTSQSPEVPVLWNTKFIHFSVNFWVDSFSTQGKSPPIIISGWQLVFFTKFHTLST
jgi:hypothetical protein